MLDDEVELRQKIRILDWRGMETIYLSRIAHSLAILLLVCVRFPGIIVSPPQKYAYVGVILVMASEA